MVTCNPQFMPLKSQNAILYVEALPSPYKTAQSGSARPDADGPLRRGAVHSSEFPGGGLRFLDLYAIIWQSGRASACLEEKIFYEITVCNRAAPLLFRTLFIGLRSLCCRMGRCKEAAAKTPRRNNRR